MRTVITLLAAGFLSLGLLSAADVTGKWKGTVEGPGGESFDLTFNLTQDGTKLSGSAETPGGAITISEGKVDGENVSFVVNAETGQGNFKVTHTGSVHGGEMNLQVQMGDQPAHPMKLTKQKE